MNRVFSDLIATQSNVCEGRFNCSLARPIVVQLFDSRTQILFSSFETKVLPTVVDPFATSIISKLSNDTSIEDKVTFAIQTRDLYGNNLTTGAIPVNLIADGPSPLMVSIFYTNDGRHNITFSATAVGHYFLRIWTA